MSPYQCTIKALQTGSVQYLPGEYFYDGEEAEHMGESAGLPGCVVIACNTAGIKASQPEAPCDLRDWPRQAKELLGLSEDAANRLFRDEDILCTETEVIRALSLLEKRQKHIRGILSRKDVDEALETIKKENS